MRQRRTRVAREYLEVIEEVWDGWCKFEVRRGSGSGFRWTRTRREDGDLESLRGSGRDHESLEDENGRQPISCPTREG